MIEIVFSDSACGSLKFAQYYGKGKYMGGATAVFLQTEGANPPTAEEIAAAQRRAEEKARREWENAIPLGGSHQDIYSFPMTLSVGDISEAAFYEGRRAAFERLFSIYPADEGDNGLNEMLQECRDNLTAVKQRYAAGEAVRVWYSDNPDELCGMYWLMAQLRPMVCDTPVYLVKLPAYDYTDEGTLISRQGWGDVAPGEWGKFVSLQEEARPAFIAACAGHWRQLQSENAPLRAVLNGRLQSVPEDIYDSFILRELAQQPDEFKMPIVIGNVLGKYRLGISDAWIALRMEQRIEDGLLEVVEEAEPGDVKYRRVLRKCFN